MPHKPFMDAMFLHMNGGDGQTSYANNSYPQRLKILKTKPFIEEAIDKLFYTSRPTKFNIVDLGCSSGPNCLLAITLILDAALRSCQHLCCSCPEFHVYLNDLPANDFNSIFKLIPSSFMTKKADQYGAPCFVSATPGSFYGRLFQSQSLQFAYSSNSLHWLPRVPPLLTCELSNLSKGNIGVGQTGHYAVYEAYLDEFRRNFFVFLKMRSEEIVPGGCLVLALAGRPKLDPFAEECYSLWDDLARALSDLVEEGLVEESKMTSFNVPYYSPYIEELREIIQEEGSFDANRLEAIPWDQAVDFDCTKSSYLGNGHSMKTCNMANDYSGEGYMRAAMEPMLKKHFSHEITERLCQKFEKHFVQSGKPQPMLLVASLSRKE